jgi:hypothetical protein
MAGGADAEQVFAAVVPRHDGSGIVVAPRLDHGSRKLA